MPTELQTSYPSKGADLSEIITPVAVAAIWLALYLAILMIDTSGPVAPFDWRFAATF